MKLFAWTDRLLVLVAVSALIGMMLLTTVSVIGRRFFNSPIPDDLVMSEFLMVFVVFLPFSAVQAAREHVFVTIFTDWMSNRTKVIMETFGVVVGFGIFTVISMAVFTDFLAAWSVGAYVEGPLELPESPARFAVFFGLAVFSLRLLVDSITSIYGLVRGRAVASLSEKARLLGKQILTD
ncbi:MAG: TRAP transporter small permease [SAR324 cluster bacterium]|nr:TRAP transporter small permease [SAR324 cluster bacterium]